MSRYVLALLLINTCYRSLCSPLPILNPLPSLLSALENECGNQFLSKQIRDKAEECSKIDGKVHLRCWIFFDINKQLCAAVTSSKLVLNEDNSTVINKPEDVSVLCSATQDWVFSNLSENPSYKSGAEKAFKQPSYCGKYCGSSTANDYVTVDADFFCKYFKWGQTILKTTKSIPSSQGDVAEANEAMVEKAADISTAGKSEDNAQEVEMSVQGLTEKATVKATLPKTVIALPDINEEQKVQSNLETTSKKLPMPPVATVPEKSSEADLKVKNEEVEDTAVESAASGIQAEKPDVKTSKTQATLNKEQEGASQVIKPHEGDVNNNVADRDPAEDYQEQDENSVGKDDDMEEQSDPNVKPDLEQSKNTNMANKAIAVEGFNDDHYSANINTMPDIYADDDDNDHFFSFFLTAIILVILLYVLYHNKNKVTKVFFGLILEGRQASRRRNSRGHAYRRLDTLEQAMSTNSAAPPSKIIY